MLNAIVRFNKQYIIRSMANRKDLISAHGRLVGGIEEDCNGRINAFGWNGKLYGFMQNNCCYNQYGQYIGEGIHMIGFDLIQDFMKEFPGDYF